LAKAAVLPHECARCRNFAAPVEF